MFVFCEHVLCCPLKAKCLNMWENIVKTTAFENGWMIRILKCDLRLSS